MHLRVGCSLVLVLLAGCPIPATTGPASVPTQRPASTTPQVAILATAHISHGAHLLGRPFDEHFQPLSGSEGRSVFEQPPKLLTVPRNIWEHRALVLNRTQWVKANLSAWGLLRADGSYDVSKRYATRRIYHLTNYVEVDDTQKMRDVPPGAKYYLWRIYYGHLYENVVAGSYDKFHATASIGFKTWGGGFQSFAEKYSLELQEVSRGLRPRDKEQAFVAVGSDMQGNFVKEAAQPILAEFRSIPSAPPPLDVDVKFSEEPPWEDGTYILSVRSAEISPHKLDGSPRTGIPGVVVQLSLDNCRTYIKSTAKKREMHPTWVGENVTVRLRGDDRLCVNIADYGWILLHGSIGRCETVTFDRLKLTGNRIVARCGGVQRLEIGVYKDTASRE